MVSLVSYFRNGAMLRLFSELNAISKGPSHFLKNTLKHLVFPHGPFLALGG